MKKKPLLYVSLCFMMTTSILSGCTTTPDESMKESAKLEQEQRKSSDYTLRTMPHFNKTWNNLTKNSLNFKFKGFSQGSNYEPLPNGVVLTVPQNSPDEKTRIKMFQAIIPYEKLSESEQEKTIEMSAKSLFANITEDDLAQLKVIYGLAKKVNVNQKELSMPMIVLGNNNVTMAHLPIDEKGVKKVMMQVEKKNIKPENKGEAKHDN